MAHAQSLVVRSRVNLTKVSNLGRVFLPETLHFGAVASAELWRTTDPVAMRTAIAEAATRRSRWIPVDRRA